MNKRKRSGRRAILCPICTKGRILDVADKVSISQIKLFGPENAEQADWFVKCPKCGAQIGGVIT